MWHGTREVPGLENQILSISGESFPALNYVGFSRRIYPRIARLSHLRVPDYPAFQSQYETRQVARSYGRIHRAFCTTTESELGCNRVIALTLAGVHRPLIWVTWGSDQLLGLASLDQGSTMHRFRSNRGVSKKNNGNVREVRIRM